MLITKIEEGQIITPDEGVDVFLRPSPLRQERHHLRLPAGLSIAEILRDCDASFGLRGNFERLHVSIGGHGIPECNWPRLRVKPGVTVNIVRVPGKGALRSIVSAVISIFALVVAPYLAGPLIGGLSAAAAGAVKGLIAAGISLAGSMVVNALFPIAPQENTAEKTKTLYSIGGATNQASQYGAIPEIFGEHRVSPPYAAGAYTELSANDQYVRMIFCVGYGPIDISDVKIAETAIDSYEDVDWEIIEDHTAEEVTLYTRPVYEETVSVLLDEATSWTTRTTADNIDEISVDYSFPSGVYRIDDEGKRRKYTVVVQAQYRAVGEVAWSALGLRTVTSSSSQPRRHSFRASVDLGQYEVRMRKASSDYEGGDTVTEALYWTAIRGRRRDAAVVTFGQPLTLIAMRIKATNQLNGSVNQLNCLARPKILAFNGSNWVPEQITRNPADHFRRVLQGPANARPVPDSGIDFDSIEGWWQFCKDEGFTFDYVATEQSSVYERLTQIAATGRASVTYRDAKWGVVWDEAGSTIVQHFTPRNSWAFSSIRAYVDLPHGFRVSFINRDNGYLNDERVVYDDGYSEANATKFEGIDFPGVTDPDLIWRHGRYHIAQLRLQREVYTLTTDWEHLVCTRGDRVRVNHDVVLWGIGAARVKSVIASPAEGVVLDDTMTMEAGKTYSIRFRASDGSSIIRTVDGLDGEFTELAFSDTGDLPGEGDLAQFGENGLESVVLRVKSITPQADLTAKIELVDDAPGILDADAGAIPPFDTGIAPVVNYLSFAPQDLTTIESVWTTTPATSVLDLSWVPPEVGSVSSYVVQFRENGEEAWITVSGVLSPRTQITDLPSGVYNVRIRAVFDNGQLSGWLERTVALTIFATPPGDVADFRISINGDLATLQWTALADDAVSHYEIRFSPNVSDAAWQTASLLRGNAPGNQVQVPALVGTYLIKAVNFAGVKSTSAALVVSSVNPLTAFNAVEEIQEAPHFGGAKTDLTVVSSGLRLESGGDVFEVSDVFSSADVFLAGGGFPSLGIYEFEDIVDLGMVYTSRVSAAISAYGTVTSEDVFSYSDVFDLPDVFGTASQDLWDVTVDVSVTDDDPSGTPVWSGWSELVTSDISARAFRFRARLRSYQFDVTPVVTAMSVTVDMPDRVLAEEDLAVTVSGRIVSFSPPYFRLKGLAISAQGLQTGDYADITDKDESGFTIIFRNASGTPVARTFDYVAKGYGSVQ